MINIYYSRSKGKILQKSEVDLFYFFLIVQSSLAGLNLSSSFDC